MPSARFTWSRPTTHIYSYNREAQKILDSRSERASSVTASASAMSQSRSSRAASVASDAFKGYSGYYGRQLQQVMQTRGPTAAETYVAPSRLRASSPAPVIYPAKSSAASASASMSASKTSMTQEKTTTTVEKTASSSVKIDTAAEMSKSLQYGRNSTSRALRRAELHAAHSGKDPRHTVLPRNTGDDICYMVADLHISPFESKELNSAKSASMQGRVKVERLEKELDRLTESAMSYKSIYAKSAAQMAKEALEACEMEAASSKKIRRTVVEETSRGSVAAA